jgi:hypothetical protein
LFTLLIRQDVAGRLRVLLRPDVDDGISLLGFSRVILWKLLLIFCGSLLPTTKGYVKDLAKSTSPVFRSREVFEHCLERYSANGERLKVVLKVLSFARSVEPHFF